MNTTTSPSRAIVLGGGGSAGIAWESGLLAGLLEAGADLGAADLVVGTSAGSAVAVQLRAGGLRLDALRADLQPSVDGVAVSAEVPAWAGYALPEAGGSEDA